MRTATCIGSIALAVAGGVFFTAVSACSSSSGSHGSMSADSGTGSHVMDSGTSGAVTDSGGTTTTGHDSGTVTATEGGTGTADAGDSVCASKGDSCYDCCDMYHQAGATVLNNAFTGCICTASTCQTQCATTDCDPDGGSPPDGGVCDTCENMYFLEDGGGTCGVAIGKACNASTDCVADLNCYDTCQ